MHSVQDIVIAYGRQRVVLTLHKAGRQFVGRIAAMGRARRWRMEFSAGDPGSVVELAVSYVLEREHAHAPSSRRNVTRRIAA
jgi:hypothetical protein